MEDNLTKGTAGFLSFYAYDFIEVSKKGRSYIQTDDS